MNYFMSSKNKLIVGDIPYKNRVKIVSTLLHKLFFKNIKNVNSQSARSQANFILRMLIQTYNLSQRFIYIC